MNIPVKKKKKPLKYSHYLKKSVRAYFQGLYGEGSGAKASVISLFFLCVIKDGSISPDIKRTRIYGQLSQFPQASQVQRTVAADLQKR